MFLVRMVRGQPGEAVMLIEPVSWIILHQLKIVLSEIAPHKS